MSYNPIEIFTLTELEGLIKEGVINNDLIIKGEHVKALNGISKINGSLGLNETNISNLSNIKEITGDFWTCNSRIYPELSSLGNLEEIGGCLSIRYSNISDLGKLQKVGGQVNLRDTPIETLGNLKYIGGNLFLPKKLEKRIDLTNIEIRGKVRYWNDSKVRIKLSSKKELNLVKYSDKVPYWKNDYIYSLNEINNASIEQQIFYKFYKDSFLKNVYIDIEGNDNYSFILLFDLFSSFKSENLEIYINKLGKYYPIIKGQADYKLFENNEKQGNYIKSWDIIYNRDYINVETIIKYEKIFHRKLLDGSLIIKLSEINHLTNFGKNNINKIIPFAVIQLKKYEENIGKDFFDLFFMDNEPIKIKKKKKQFLSIFKKKKNTDICTIDFEYYKQFFTNEEEYNYYKEIDINHKKINYQKDIPYIVERAINSQCKVILKQSEDLYRINIGMPKIGEGWISETELFYKIKTSFSNTEVNQHASPQWLGRQHFDVYIPEFNIAIEYQGVQHYKAVDFFGGEEGLKKTIERDERKKEKCDDNGCKLIYVNEGYDYNEVYIEIKNIIKTMPNKC